VLPGVARRSLNGLVNTQEVLLKTEWNFNNNLYQQVAADAGLLK